jgi:suppressor for copper-sensitivity B
VKRTLAGLVLFGLFASNPAAAQVARLQKASLRLEPASLEAVAGSATAFEAVVAIDGGWHVQANVPTYDYLIPTELTVDLPAGFPAAEVEYPAPILYEFAFADEELDVYEGTIRLPVRLTVPAGPATTVSVTATLRYQACDDKSCLPPVETTATADLVVIASAAASTSASAPAARDAPAPVTETGALPSRSLLTILLLAMVGGLILNAMPCVLPILSLKVFGLVKASGQARSQVRSGALATAAGILVSFWALAFSAIAARSAGAAIGWGVQFQQPGFVAFLALVVLLFSLNLWGLFEITLPAGLARWADSGSGGEGLGGHFASGLFTTLMATPCSAPFLGTALSFALGQPAGTIVATLTAVGVGLALPYLVLAVAPGAVRFLPRPGAWMDTLRGIMGFLLAGALVWLLYVLTQQIVTEAVAFFELLLLALALAAWLASRAAPGGLARRTAVLAALVLAAWAVILPARAPERIGTVGSGTDGSGLDWVVYDRVEAERLAGDGRLVFLDITADWCVTCKVNERVILHTPEVVAAFRDHEVVAMKADWTNRDDEIARFLAEHGRYGIPFYMLWRPGREPHVFGELISRQGVIDVIAESASSPTG